MSLFIFSCLALFLTSNCFSDQFSHINDDLSEILKSMKNKNEIIINLENYNRPSPACLSKYFNFIVRVSSKKTTLDWQKNEPSPLNCTTIVSCDRPIASSSKPRIPANGNTVKPITFKQLIHDYVFENDTISEKSIDFIKCDIEGSEEDVLEDILYFAYHNHVKTYISFHIPLWKEKKIDDFKNLFSFFKTNCPENDICNYLEKNPYSSLLFEPIQKQEALIKSNMPVIIIAYEQVTFIKNMVKQLEKHTSDIIIIDNNSKFQPLLDYYNDEYNYTLLKQKKNFSQTVFCREPIQKLVGDFYIVTDPDLQFNTNLPENLMSELVNISNWFQAYKVGFAICIDDPNIRTDCFYGTCSIKEWESQFWKYPVHYPVKPNYQIYLADMDTTFCLINRKSPNRTCYRLAGDFTMIHIPFMHGYKEMLMVGEFESYRSGNNSTNWMK
jgi:hypothetical protein